MKRKSGGWFLPVAGMAVIFMVWFFVFKSSPPPPQPLTTAQKKFDSSVLSRGSTPEVGWRTLYRDNWEFLCPVLGHQVVDPGEACRLVAAPARLGPIVVRDGSVRYDKPFTTKRDPSVPLVKIKDLAMGLPEYVGHLFYSQRFMCSLYPGKWEPTNRPVIDKQGKLIRYDEEHVRIFCGGGK